MSPQELDLPCVRCGGTTAMTYQNGWLYYVCLECETSPLASDAPPGALFGEPFSPAAFRAREPSELFAAAFFKLLEVTTMKAGGLCPRCDGPIESQLSVCGDHEVADETCPNCGQIRPAVIRWLCPICKFVGSGSPGGISMTRPELITFYTEHGVDLANPGSSVETAKRIWQLINAHTQEVVSTDPARVRVTASYDDASITLLYDEDVDVIAVE